MPRDIEDRRRALCKLLPSPRDPTREALHPRHTSVHNARIDAGYAWVLSRQRSPRLRFRRRQPCEACRSDIIPLLQKTCCRKPGKFVYPQLSCTLPPCRYDKSLASGLSSFVDPYQSSLPLSHFTLRRPSDDCPAHGVKALRALRWRTMVAFHEKVS